VIPAAQQCCPSRRSFVVVLLRCIQLGKLTSQPVGFGLCLAKPALQAGARWLLRELRSALAPASQPMR
jgi:hypothetical protein